ncbi:MAG: hypothetical protein ACR2HP_10675 [Ilumatobacteraceae bacterium]
MCSPAAVGDVDVLFGSVSALGLSLDELDGQGLTARLQDLERVVRRAEAAIVAVLDTADQRGSWKADGLASVRGWARATVRWSDPEVRDRTRTVTLVRDAPAIGEELAAGRIGVAQVRELARARANPRVGEQLVEALPLLIGHAQELPFHDFRICCSAGNRSATSTAPATITRRRMPGGGRTRRWSATRSTSTFRAVRWTGRR